MSKKTSEKIDEPPTLAESPEVNVKDDSTHPIRRLKLKKSNSRLYIPPAIAEIPQERSQEHEDEVSSYLDDLTRSVDEQHVPPNSDISMLKQRFQSDLMPKAMTTKERPKEHMIQKNQMASSSNLPTKKEIKRYRKKSINEDEPSIKWAEQLGDEKNVKNSSFLNDLPPKSPHSAQNRSELNTLVEDNNDSRSPGLGGISPSN
jgi:hypothetical protein